MTVGMNNVSASSSEVSTAFESLDSTTTQKLFAVMRELSNLHDTNSITDVVRTSARELTGADGITFVLRDNDFCFYANEHAIEPLWKGRRFPIHSCVSGWAMLHAEVVNIPDIYKDPRIPQDLYRETFVKSLVMTPIRMTDPIGSIGAYWADYHVATPAELQMLQIIADATAIALANAQLYEQLTTSAKRKDELIIMLAHELRNPLAPLRTAAKLLLLTPSDPEKVLMMQKIIDRQVAHLGSLVEGLLEMSRLETGKIAVDQVPIDIRELMQALAHDHERLFEESSQRLVLHVPDIPVMIKGDASRLRQIVENIFDNARKHAGSHVTVDVSLIDTGSSAVIMVRDDGAGIPSDFLASAFEPLAQADRSLDRRKGGLGIGLAVVKALVELHRGTVTVMSEGPGKGVEFTLTFPKCELTEAPARLVQ